MVHEQGNTTCLQIHEKTSLLIREMLIAPRWHGSLTNLAEIKGLQITWLAEMGNRPLLHWWKVINCFKKNLQGAFGRIYKIHNNTYLDPESLYVELQEKPGTLSGSDCRG